MIYIIEGGPRRAGNGAYLAEKIAEQHAGDDVRRLRLYDMNYKGCASCRKCRETGSYCVRKDDLSPLFPELAEADKIVLIAPCFHGFASGEVKMFVDRLYCMRNADKTSKYKEGAKLIFIATVGSPNRGKADVMLNWMKNVAEHSMLKYYGLAVPNCSFENLDGVKMKEEEIMMNIKFFA